MPTHEQSCTFLSIPRALRDLIYSALVLATPRKMSFCQSTAGQGARIWLDMRNGRLKNGVAGSDLLQCSRQVFEEFSECIFSCAFSIKIDDNNIGQYMDLQQQMPTGPFRERVRFIGLFVAIGHNRATFAELPDLSALKTLKSLASLSLGVLLCDSSVGSEEMLQSIAVNPAKSTLLNGFMVHYVASLPTAVSLTTMTTKSIVTYEGGYIGVSAKTLLDLVEKYVKLIWKVK